MMSWVVMDVFLLKYKGKTKGGSTHKKILHSSYTFCGNYMMYVFLYRKSIRKILHKISEKFFSDEKSVPEKI